MSDQQRLKHGWTISLFLVPLGLIGVGLAVDNLERFSSYREYVGSTRIPDVLVKSGKTGKELRLLEYASLANVELDGFDKDLAPNDMPSTTIVRAIAERSGLATLSVVVDPQGLLDRDTGILANYDQRGRGWERAGYSSFFNHGELEFASAAGVRVHGGKSRAMVNKSFRLYFRDLYGAAQAPSRSILGEDVGPIRTLVVHNDLRIKRGQGDDAYWRFANPLAYDLVSELGSITPATQPVQFYLNGEYIGPYVLTEHISSDFLIAHFGHDDFIFARTKQDVTRGVSRVESGNEERFRDLENLPGTLAAPLDLDELAAVIDIENFTNWMIGILYAGVTDPYQGAALLDETDPEARWFWVTWDMDHAFMDWYGQVEHPWEIDMFTGHSGVLPSKRFRGAIFTRLLKESPEYRRYFLARITEVLNHLLTPEFVAGRVTHYEEIAASFGIEDAGLLDSIRDFARHRPGVLRQQLDEYFGVGESFRLTVKADLPGPLLVDGHPVAGEYGGFYFAETPVTVELPQPAGTESVAWRVDGRRTDVAGNRLQLDLTADTVIDIASYESVESP